jgi:hypothetical protein
MKKIVSFSTIPLRIEKMEDVIASICNQSLMPDEIILWIPKYYSRLKDSIKKIPDYLNKYPVIIKESPEDYGPFTKLRPSLDYCDDNDIIVTCDDDILYPQKWFENLVTYSAKFPDNAICYRGRRLTKKRRRINYNRSEVVFGSGDKEYDFVDLITGTRGVLYKKRFFTDYMYTNDYKKMYMVDDIWINGNLAMAGTKSIVIPNPGFKEDETIEMELYNIDSLYEHNKDGSNNTNGLDFFKEYFK